ncbi:MAG: KEOPS complex subunit Pcc1 [Nitrosopumilus sp.]
MTSNFSAKITIHAKDKTKAIYDSINTDNEFYPENPVKTQIKFNKQITVLVESEHLPHLRANLNSTLRLVQASYDSMESVKI